jgi:hypothetical protein
MQAAASHGSQGRQPPRQQDGGGDEGDEGGVIQAMGARCYHLFVPEAIPRAVKASNQRLSAALRDHLGPVAWGNTNSKAGDYKGVRAREREKERKRERERDACVAAWHVLPRVSTTHTPPPPSPPHKLMTNATHTTKALRAAEAYGRRAVLLRWGLELERVPLEELLVRNALRASRLGRYIPAVSIKVRVGVGLCVGLWVCVCTYVRGSGGRGGCRVLTPVDLYLFPLTKPTNPPHPFPTPHPHPNTKNKKQQMALERTEALLARTGGGDGRALLTMAGFTADPQGRPRSNVPPPEEAEPLVRPFAGVERRVAAAPAGGEVGAIVCTDTAAWGAGRRSSSSSSSAAAAAAAASLAGGWDAGGGDNFILATGVGAGAVALGGSRSGSSSSGDNTRAVFVGGVGRLSRALGQLQQASAALGPLLVLRMGEWSKFKYWSKASYDMDWEWRRDYQRARNQTLQDREEMIRTNGTDPWATRGSTFDFELWTLLRTLSGQSSINNKF